MVRIVGLIRFLYSTGRKKSGTRKQWPIDAWQTKGRLPLRLGLEFIFATSSFVVPDSRLFEGKAQQSTERNEEIICTQPKCQKNSRVTIKASFAVQN